MRVAVRTLVALRQRQAVKDKVEAMRRWARAVVLIKDTWLKKGEG